MRCSDCGRSMRDYGITRDQAPDTVPRGSGDACQTCVNRRGGAPAVPAIDDEPIVPVKTMLRPSTYRVFAAHGKALGISVGDLLTRLADKAVRPEPRPTAITGRKPRAAREPKPRVEDELDARIRELNGQGLSDTTISRVIGLSQGATSRRRRMLGLESPTPRVGGRQKAA